jgi:hypothetical protein
LQSEESKKTSIRYYRDKEKDAKLYVLLSETMDRFVTHERLQEMAHTLDTNMNEAFNQICTWFAPKNKVFAGTGSLQNRISFAVGINSLGLDGFFNRLFKKLGIAVTDNVAYYLKIKEKSRVKRLAKLKVKESKKKRNKRKYDKLAEHTLQAKKELHKREGTYRRGMNLDDTVEDTAQANTEAAKANNNKANRMAKYCEFCGKKDHLTKRSKKCTAQQSVVKRFNCWKFRVHAYGRTPGPIRGGYPCRPMDAHLTL